MRCGPMAWSPVSRKRWVMAWIRFGRRSSKRCSERSRRTPTQRTRRYCPNWILICMSMSAGSQHSSAAPAMAISALSASMQNASPSSGFRWKRSCTRIAAHTRFCHPGCAILRWPTLITRRTSVAWSPLSPISPLSTRTRLARRRRRLTSITPGCWPRPRATDEPNF